MWFYLACGSKQFHCFSALQASEATIDGCDRSFLETEKEDIVENTQHHRKARFHPL